MLLRSEVIWFGSEMEKVLTFHDSQKGVVGWKDEDPDWLFNRLKDEVYELKQALEKINYSSVASKEEFMPILKECVDVANFAMFIADRLRQ